MKFEKSAGGVVVRKNDSDWQVLLIHDMNNQWTFPKGVIEAGEIPQATAAREIAEETGLTDISLLSELSDITYKYERNGLISKTVYYFLFKTQGNVVARPQKSEGINKVKWFPLNKAINIVDYPNTNIKILIQARSYLQKYS